MLKTSQILAQSRSSKGLTQQQLAEEIGVSRQTIAMWEIDKRLPTDSVAILTARLLGLEEEGFLLRLQNEKLKIRVQRLQEQYGATIIISETPNYGGLKMKDKHTAYQTQQSVHFAVTNIHKSIGFEYPEELMRVKRERGSFDSPFEISIPEECLVIKTIIQSENERFIPNWHYAAHCHLTDNLGNDLRAIGMGLRASTPPEELSGSVVETYTRFRYIPGAQSITLKHEVANAYEDDCDFVLFENVRITDNQISRRMDGCTITYDGVKTTKISDPQGDKEIRQIHIRLGETGNPRYVGINRITDNLGNEYSTNGFSWNLEDGREEGFVIEELAPEAESISFKYLIAKTVLDFQFSDLPIPS